MMFIHAFIPSRGDHTSADSYLTVLPRATEFVVFSIDGSFAASVSIMGSDPKVRAGAVDVVRYITFNSSLSVCVSLANRLHFGRGEMQIIRFFTKYLSVSCC